MGVIKLLSYKVIKGKKLRNYPPKDGFASGEEMKKLRKKQMQKYKKYNYL
jgi:hypothetical protein